MKVRLILPAALLLAACCGTCCGVYGQTMDVELSSEYDDQHNLNIDAKHTGYGSRTIYIMFGATRNCDKAADEFFVIRSSGRITTIKPIDKSSYPYVPYRYWVIYGAFNPPHVDSLITFRLPFSTAKTVKARTLHNVDDRHFGGGNNENWIAWQFILNDGDTVYAARKGQVVKIVDTEDPATGRGKISMSSKYNYINIEHRDGTIAMYSVLKKGGMMVEEGDWVYPGTPIALAGSYDGQVFQVRFKISYKTYKQTENPNYADQISMSHYINPYFATTQGNVRLIHNTDYTPVQTRELVTHEMTKREVKKYFPK